MNKCLSNSVVAKRWSTSGEMIQSVVGSGIDVNRTEKRKLAFASNRSTNWNVVLAVL